MFDALAWRVATNSVGLIIPECVCRNEGEGLLRARYRLVASICRCSVNGGFLREKIIDSRGGVG